MNFEILVKSRQNILKMLTHRKIDVAAYENFTQEELKRMLQQSLLDKSFINPEPGPMDMIVKNPNGTSTYVKYRLDKIKTARAIESFIEQIYKTQLKPSDNLVIIAHEKINIPGSSFETMLNNFYNQKGYFVQIISLTQLLINIVEHRDVPKHEVITEIEKKEFESPLSRFKIIRTTTPNAPMISR